LNFDLALPYLSRKVLSEYWNCGSKQEADMTSRKFVLLTAALLVGTSLLNSAQARGGGGGGGGGSASNGSSGNGASGLSATPTQPNPNSIFQNPFQNPITRGIPPAASTTFFNPNAGVFNQNAGQTINTGTVGSTPPTNPMPTNAGGRTLGSTPATLSVGHAPNGLPIGSAGSGPGSPEQPIDSGSR
jgi:hypothetical protein